MHGGSSLYALDAEALAAAEPDLVITQELCRVCAVGYEEVNEVVRRIDADITVISLEPTSIEGIFNSITTVGAMTEVEDAAVDVVEGLRERLSAIERKVVERREAGRRRPAWSASNGSTRRSRSGTGSRSRSAGRAAGTCSAPTGPRPSRRPGTGSPTSTPSCCSSCRAASTSPRPSTNGRGHRVPSWYEDLPAVRRGPVFALDGSSYFSRPGPAVIDGIELLAEIIDPDGFVDVAPPGGWTPVD